MARLVSYSVAELLLFLSPPYSKYLFQQSATKVVQRVPSLSIWFLDGIISSRHSWL